MVTAERAICCFLHSTYSRHATGHDTADDVPEFDGTSRLSKPNAAAPRPSTCEADKVNSSTPTHSLTHTHLLLLTPHRKRETHTL